MPLVAHRPVVEVHPSRDGDRDWGDGKGRGNGQRAGRDQLGLIRHASPLPIAAEGEGRHLLASVKQADGGLVHLAAALRRCSITSSRI